MASPSDAPRIVWFRDDLRLSDHPALNDAGQSGAPMICLYVLDEESGGARPPRGRPLGAASRWWLAQSLRALDASLKRLGQTLVLRRGRTAEVIAAIAQETNAAGVNWIANDIVGHAAIENEVAQALDKIGVAYRAFPSDLLAKPSTVRNKEAVGCASSPRSGSGS
jgi:deoxyribodipyrimidine photo-lyase